MLRVKARRNSVKIKDINKYIGRVWMKINENEALKSKDLWKNADKLFFDTDNTLIKEKINIPKDIGKNLKITNNNNMFVVVPAEDEKETSIQVAKPKMIKSVPSEGAFIVTKDTKLDNTDNEVKEEIKDSKDNKDNNEVKEKVKDNKDNNEIKEEVKEEIKDNKDNNEEKDDNNVEEKPKKRGRPRRKKGLNPDNNILNAEIKIPIMEDNTEINVNPNPKSLDNVNTDISEEEEKALPFGEKMKLARARKRKERQQNKTDKVISNLININD